MPVKRRGFLSVLFLMDVLAENHKKDVAYQLLFRAQCPSRLYEAEHGVAAMWEGWGPIGGDGIVSTTVITIMLSVVCANGCTGRFGGAYRPWNRETGYGMITKT